MTSGSGGHVCKIRGGKTCHEKGGRTHAFGVLLAHIRNARQG